MHAYAHAKRTHVSTHIIDITPKRLQSRTEVHSFRLPALRADFFITYHGKRGAYPGRLCGKHYVFTTGFPRYSITKCGTMLPHRFTLSYSELSSEIPSISLRRASRRLRSSSYFAFVSSAAFFSASD